jgi:hypothetical protein
VPQRLTEFYAATEYFDLVLGSGRSVGPGEAVFLLGDEIFVVPIAEDRFENVLARTHVSSPE